MGSVLEGKVTGITKFGAFVSLPDNKSGLVHISEIAYSYVNDIHDHLQEGQQVKVKVIGIDDNKRINLSIKKAMDPPPRPQNSDRGERADRGDRGDRADRGERIDRGDRGDRAERNDRGNQTARAPRSASSSFTPRPAQPKGPMDFEDQLKQFMTYSDSKLSELHMNDRRSSRRGNGGGRRS